MAISAPMSHCIVPSRDAPPRLDQPRSQHTLLPDRGSGAGGNGHVGQGVRSRYDFGARALARRNIAAFEASAFTRAKEKARWRVAATPPA